MKQPKFNSEQIALLLKNVNVAKCSSKAISYSKAFKVLAVRQYAEGMTATQIFRAADLPPELVGENIAKDQLKNWRNKFMLHGEVGLLTEARGTAGGGRSGRPKIKGLTDADRIKRLEIENAYLKAKYDFLVKLRAQRKS